MRLLVVDDCREIVKLLASIMKLSGHGVDVAYDGIEAIERLRHKSYDVVITDAEMPRMGGVGDGFVNGALKHDRINVRLRRSKRVRRTKHSLNRCSYCGGGHTLIICKYRRFRLDNVRECNRDCKIVTNCHIARFV